MVTCRALISFLVAALALQTNATGRDFSADFAVVFADATTEAKLEKLPLSRAVLADAIEWAAKAGARGVILKFFLDRPRQLEGDRALAHALTLLPVLLQARIDDTEAASNDLPSRFLLPGDTRATAINGTGAWIPIPPFSAPAHDICFVDFLSATVPVIESYRGASVKSLLLCAVELATGERAIPSAAGTLAFMGNTLPTDELFRLSVPIVDLSPLETLTLHDLLDGSIAASSLKGKVVILAYDGPNINRLDSGYGAVGAHRLFVLLLRDFYQSLPDGLRPAYGR